MILVLDQSYGGEYLPLGNQLACRVDGSQLTDFSEFNFYVLNGCWSGTFKEGRINHRYMDEDDEPLINHRPYKVRVYIPQSYLDDNEYVKKYNFEDQYEDTITLLDNTIEKYRNEVINSISHVHWYRVLEVEDELNLKYANEDDLNPKIVEILNRGEGGISAYRQMMHYRNQRFQIHNLQMGYVHEK